MQTSILVGAIVACTLSAPVVFGAELKVKALSLAEVTVEVVRQENMLSDEANLLVAVDQSIVWEVLTDYNNLTNNQDVRRVADDAGHLASAVPLVVRGDEVLAGPLDPGHRREIGSRYPRRRVHFIRTIDALREFPLISADAALDDGAHSLSR